MPSLGELAKRARKGEKVKGGTELASAEEGTDQFYDEQGAIVNRRTLSGVKILTPEEQEEERRKKLSKLLGQR